MFSPSLLRFSFFVIFLLGCFSSSLFFISSSPSSPSSPLEKIRLSVEITVNVNGEDNEGDREGSPSIGSSYDALSLSPSPSPSLFPTPSLHSHLVPNKKNVHSIGSNSNSHLDASDSHLPLYTFFNTKQHDVVNGHPVVGGHQSQSGVSAHYGIDISDYEDVLDATAAVAHLRKLGNGATPFVFVKATEGNTVTDSATKSSLAKFRAAGAEVGAYLFLHPADAISTQVNHFNKNIYSVKILIIDSEVTDGKSMTTALSKTKSALEALGPGSWVYLNADFFQQYKELDAAFPWGHHVWLAQYANSPTKPSMIWQYTEHGHVDGVRGDEGIDVDVFLGTEEMWNEFIVNASPSVGGGQDPYPTSDECNAAGGICWDNEKSPCKGTILHNMCGDAKNVICCAKGQGMKENTPSPIPTPLPSPSPRPAPIAHLPLPLRNPTPFHSPSPSPSPPPSTSHCESLSGHCLSPSSASSTCGSNGSLLSGLCDNTLSPHDLCCLPTSYPSSLCTSHHGYCVDTNHSHCSGTLKSHLCNGGKNIQCCVV